MQAICSGRSGDPSRRMVPESGTRIWLMMRISVVFPAPLGPSKPKIRWEGISRDTESSALFGPKDLLTSRMLTMLLMQVSC